MKCKYEHDGDCCHAGADQYMCKCKKPREFLWALSNADRIRSMSDEELAVFLECFGVCHYCPEHERLENEPLLRGERCDEDCEKHMLDWLKQPYEEKP